MRKALFAFVAVAMLVLAGTAFTAQASARSATLALKLGSTTSDTSQRVALNASAGLVVQ